ncbi:MAG TPA: hypothetical protein VIN04_05400 [Myxococcota bacterium]
MGATIAEGVHSCATCGRTIPDFYYEADGRTLCVVCKDGVTVPGSRLTRLLGAVALGTLAAALAGGAWYAITAWTGREFGLVALVVGLFVGVAVRVGSRGRGGWLYQTLAVVLTYLGIASSYVPYTLAGLEEAAAEAAVEAEEAARSIEDEESEALYGDGLLDPPSEPADAQPASGDALATPVEVERIVLWITAVGLAIAVPVLQVTEGGFVGTLIVCFALFEAWKINRGSGGVMGPFPVGGVAGAPPAA